MSKATYYPGKVHEPITINSTPDTRDDMALCKEQTEASRSDLMEHSWRKFRGLPVNPDLDAKLAALPPIETAL